MRASGDPRIVNADAKRTRTALDQQKNNVSDSARSSTDPAPPPPTIEDAQEEEQLFGPDSDDETDFYKVVNDDTEMQENAQAIESAGVTPTDAHEIDFENEHSTVALLDVLQTCGVAPEAAANFASSLVRNRSRVDDMYRRMTIAKRYLCSITDRPPPA